jgi:hypothetical protein
VYDLLLGLGYHSLFPESIMVVSQEAHTVLDDVMAIISLEVVEVHYGLEVPHTLEEVACSTPWTNIVTTRMVMVTDFGVVLIKLISTLCAVYGIIMTTLVFV